MTARQQLAYLYEQISDQGFALYGKTTHDAGALEDAWDRAYDATVEAGVSENLPDDEWYEARSATTLRLLAAKPCPV